ncbi:hypothetical protein CIB48_g3139 [Xylaria polymorpha]|nr:hypothetical protein CIB48_g3139 [Xylaria polymorpha]
MSSNILSRKIPISNFSTIFFGAQKNLGSTSITVVIIQKDFLPQPSAALMRQLILPIPPPLEAYPTIYQIIPDEAVRSRMNICFRIKGDNAVKEAFLKDAATGAEKLANFIGAFASRSGTSLVEVRPVSIRQSSALAGTALQAAARGGHLNDSSDQAPLSGAAEKGHKVIVQLLLIMNASDLKPISNNDRESTQETPTLAGVFDPGRPDT